MIQKQARGCGILVQAMVALVMLGGAIPLEAQTPVKAPPPGGFTAEGLTLDYITGSIKRGVEALYTNKNLQPVYTFRPEYAYRYAYNFETLHETGNHALACWALLNAGESYQNPPLFRRLNWVLSRDDSGVYDRGMRAQMLAELPYTRWAPWVRREAMWLGAALTDKGNYNQFFNGKDNQGYGDNADGLYGTLGLWGCERGGLRINTVIWKKVDEYWRSAQQASEGDAASGWALVHKEASTGNQFGRRISGPMTAGAVSALTLTERYLKGPSMGAPGDHVSKELKKGLRWLDENFSLNDKAEESDWFYYMWTVQRVGHATGYRSFNGVDWFREVTAAILNQQRPDGTWLGDKGVLLSTGFALLYLSKAYEPLAISKIRFAPDQAKGAASSYGWNLRPHDVWNLVDYFSQMYEYETTWQIVELDQPAYTLIESPILYLASDTEVTFTAEQIANLKEYIDAGGLLVTNSDGNKPGIATTTRDLANKMYPQYSLKRIEKDHPFYNIHQKLDVTMPVEVVSNGVRPLIVHFMKDVGKGLQENDWTRSDSFALMSNIYLYATGLNPHRERLSRNYIPDLNKRPSLPLAAARIKHSGEWNPEPHGLNQLKNLLANNHDVELQVENVDATKQLGPQKIAFLTTIGDGTLTRAEALRIRDWIEAGGTLWLDACGGSQAASANALKMLQQILPNAVATPISANNPIISGVGLRGGYDNKRVRWRSYALRTMGPIYSPRLQVVEGANDQIAVVYSGEDLTCGLSGLDDWNIFGYTVEAARQLVANGAMLATLNRVNMEAGAAGGEEKPAADEAKPAADEAKSASDEAKPATPD